MLVLGEVVVLCGRELGCSVEMRQWLVVQWRWQQALVAARFGGLMRWQGLIPAQGPARGSSRKLGTSPRVPRWESLGESLGQAAVPAAGRNVGLSQDCFKRTAPASCFPSSHSLQSASRLWHRPSQRTPHPSTTAQHSTPDRALSTRPQPSPGASRRKVAMAATHSSRALRTPSSPSHPPSPEPSQSLDSALTLVSAAMSWRWPW